MSMQDNMPSPVRRGSGALSPSAIRGARFTRTTIGRRGYDMEEVNRFLYRVAEQVAAGDAEKANLRAEVERLRDWIRNRMQDGEEPAAPSAAGVNAQMIALMSQAQQQADAYVAQAEAYSRRLTVEARQKADELLYEAQSMANGSHGGSSDPSDLAARLAEVQRRADWLRAFCQATQLQLQAASDAFFQEVDRAIHFPEPAVPQEGMRRSIR
jgi:DivIVA domain-containing protein